MHDLPDARTLRRRRTLVLFVALGALLLGAADPLASLHQDLRDFQRGFADGLAGR
ncbi:hypothetical protein [Sphingomonas azotifigens]|uniref:hypothetical protein n=1 Tax=Sphingomonas azotifigens TaxID=330920 RepID=UPI0014300E80|nr:hypothetical protein [Sphingomonas azotifigens]